MLSNTLQLPPEVLSYIFSMLHDVDLMICRSVCKLWKQLIEDDSRLWRPRCQRAGFLKSASLTWYALYGRINRPLARLKRGGGLAVTTLTGELAVDNIVHYQDGALAYTTYNIHNNMRGVTFVDLKRETVRRWRIGYIRPASRGDTKFSCDTYRLSVLHEAVDSQRTSFVYFWRLPLGSSRNVKQLAVSPSDRVLSYVFCDGLDIMAYGLASGSIVVESLSGDSILETLHGHRQADISLATKQDYIDGSAVVHYLKVKLVPRKTESTSVDDLLLVSSDHRFLYAWSLNMKSDSSSSSSAQQRAQYLWRLSLHAIPVETTASLGVHSNFILNHSGLAFYFSATADGTYLVKLDVLTRSPLRLIKLRDRSCGRLLFGDVNFKFDTSQLLKLHLKSVGERFCLLVVEQLDPLMTSSQTYANHLLLVNLQTACAIRLCTRRTSFPEASLSCNARWLHGLSEETVKGVLYATPSDRSDMMGSARDWSGLRSVNLLQWHLTKTESAQRHIFLEKFKPLFP